MAPQSHPRAQFVPIPPDLDLGTLVENTQNFDYVTRLPSEMLKEHSTQSLEQLILLHVVIGGKPLVIEGWGGRLDPFLFSPEWLLQNLGKTPEQVRDIPHEVDIPMTIGHYLKSMNQLTTQFTSSNYREPKRQRLYLKDIDCPDEWAKNLKGFIPEIFYYLNECIESRTGGDGAILEPNEYGQMRYGKGVAPAGDLMSSLPSEMRALNMMCYIGHEGTYTPAHREMCASLGHNIMVETSVDGKNERAGSSVWFMTETKEREVVSEYFLSMLGHDIEVEKHFAQINAWKKAPFNVYVVEQKVGDLILIPPLAPHQVWNRGTRTMKAAWNRTTVDTLELAINDALPRARMVCREEQYKNKAIIYYTLVKYHGLVTRDTVENKMWKYGRIKQLFEDFKRLFVLFADILISETFSAALPTEEDIEFLEFDSNVTCSYCRCNIWNRFLTCKTCIEMGPGGEEDTYDVCMDCYVMGRSCGCISNFNWVEQWKWSTLTQNYESWRQTVVQYDSYFNLQTSPQPLEIAMKRFGRKPVAQICQEQLKLRPWQDIKNPAPRSPSPGMSNDELDVDDEGRLKKKQQGATKARARTTAKRGKTHNCHVCYHHHDNWKQAFCTTCSNSYCYGVLWRAFDLMPQQAMEDRDWSCPKCLKICSCGKCRKSDDQTPYAPKGTLLGHDTKRVADFRSVESLVDFSKTNLGWLRGENDDHPQESARMKKLREKAGAEKNREDAIDENYLVGDEGAQNVNEQEEAQEHRQFDSMEDIDPELRDLAFSSITQSNGNSMGQYGNFYIATKTDMDVADNGPVEGDGGESHDWLDGHYDLEYIDAFNRGANYPSRLLAPVAPMEAPTPAAAPAQEPEPEPKLLQYPEPPHGQNRMMGIGYYQQGVGVENIAYDPPRLDSTNDDALDLTTAANNPNFAFSDLLPPKKIQPPKKRKLRHRSDDEDDVEFFMSKRARKVAELETYSGTSKVKAISDAGKAHKQAAAPRRNVPNPKTYIDLGEESLPFTEDDLLPAHPKKYCPDGDTQLATEAIGCLTNKFDSDDGSTMKRRTTRSLGASVTPSVALTAAKAPRKSASLARREVEECAHEFPGELPKKKRGRPRRFSSAKPKPTTAVDLLSDKANEDEGRLRIDDDDSLFGDLNAMRNSSEGSLFITPKRQNAREESSGGSTFAEPKGPRTRNSSGTNRQWRLSSRDPIVQVASILGDSEDEQQVEKPPAKRRGRPPKQAPTPMGAKSSPHTPVGTTKLISLKEKLALKGKGFKIVAKKPRKSVESSVATPLILIPRAAANGTPLASPVGVSGWSSVNQPSTLVKKTNPEDPKDSETKSCINRASTVITKASPEENLGENTWNGASKTGKQDEPDSHSPEDHFRRPSTINRCSGFDDTQSLNQFIGTSMTLRKNIPKHPQAVKLSNGDPSTSRPGLLLSRKVLPLFDWRVQVRSRMDQKDQLRLRPPTMMTTRYQPFGLRRSFCEVEDH